MVATGPKSKQVLRVLNDLHLRYSALADVFELSDELVFRNYARIRFHPLMIECYDLAGESYDEEAELIIFDGENIQKQNEFKYNLLYHQKRIALFYESLFHDEEDGYAARERAIKMDHRK